MTACPARFGARLLAGGSSVVCTHSPTWACGADPCGCACAHASRGERDAHPPSPPPFACRDACLHAAGFLDIFKATKDKENAAALQLLPEVLRELDAIPNAPERVEVALRGVFAGAQPRAPGARAWCGAVTAQLQAAAPAAVAWWRQGMRAAPLDGRLHADGGKASGSIKRCKLQHCVPCATRAL